MIKKTINIVQKSMLYLIDLTLKHPKIFEWQQRTCNSYNNVKEEFAEYLDKQNQYILDIGCSTGICAHGIIDTQNNHYFGIDIVSEYINRAQSLYPDGKFIQMDARNLAFENNYFDIITLFAVLHHMEDKLIVDCLKSIKKALKPDGVILVAEPVFT